MAIENARLFAEEQRRSRQFAFLNSVSKTAISSEDAEQMLAEIVGHIQRNFRFDHIGIGILDYATKEIEIRAEAGTTAHEKGKKIALGTELLVELPALARLRCCTPAKPVSCNHCCPAHAPCFACRSLTATR